MNALDIAVNGIDYADMDVIIMIHAGSGGTIRNHVVYPYEQVKDTRTGCVATNVNIMLETGEGLDDFLRAELFVFWLPPHV